MDFTAKSKSASGITIPGAFPPNSKETFVTLAEAAAMVCIPASTLPVRLTIPTLGLAASSCPITEPRPFTRLNTPLGNPTSSTICAKTYAFPVSADSALPQLYSPSTEQERPYGQSRKRKIPRQDACCHPNRFLKDKYIFVRTVTRNDFPFITTGPSGYIIKIISRK